MARYSKLIFSETLNCMLPAGFTTKKVLIDRVGNEPLKVCKAVHWSWRESDCLYYNDDTDEQYYMDIPNNATKAYTLKLNKKARLLVMLDKC